MLVDGFIYSTTLIASVMEACNLVALRHHSTESRQLTIFEGEGAHLTIFEGEGAINNGLDY